MIYLLLTEVSLFKDSYEVILIERRQKFAPLVDKARDYLLRGHLVRCHKEKDNLQHAIILARSAVWRQPHRLNFIKISTCRSFTFLFLLFALLPPISEHSAVALPRMLALGLAAPSESNPGPERSGCLHLLKTTGLSDHGNCRQTYRWSVGDGQSC